MSSFVNLFNTAITNHQRPAFHLRMHRTFGDRVLRFPRRTISSSRPPRKGKGGRKSLKGGREIGSMDIPIFETWLRPYLLP